jgi:regulator of nonsense transcripts 3
MSSAPAVTKSPAKSKKDKDKERREKAAPNVERLKTVVRRLPPNLPEEVFWNSVANWVTEDSVAWKTFCPGKLAKRYILS